MKTLIKNIAASMIMVGTVALSSAFAQVETQDQGLETQDPAQTEDPTQTDPQMDQQGQQAPDQQAQEEWRDDQKQREEIDISEVPSEVSENLNSGEYQDMQATRAYKITTDKGETHYEVHFTNAQGTTETKKFNEQGEEVEKDKKDKNKNKSGSDY